MKLLKCKIAAFGKLKDFEYEFTDGLNTIKHDNGWGKSTLASFIKAMFYGLDDGKRNVADNERTRFKPWNSTETFGGSIEFKWGEGEYRLERFFGKKKSEDTVRLFDIKTGKEYGKTEDLGDRIFRIDEEGFLSTTFFSQKDFEVKSNTSLTAKFNETYEAQDTALFDKAVSKLDARAKSYKYSGNRGIIPEIKEEIYAVKEKIERARRAEKEALTVKNLIESYERANEKLSAEKDALTESIKRAGKAEATVVRRERYLKCVKEKQDAEERKKSAEKILNGNRATEEVINRLKTCADDLYKNAEKEKMLNEDIKTLNENAKISSEKAKKKKRTTAIIGVTAFVFAAIVFAFMSQWLVAALCAGASVVAALYAVLGKSKTSDDALYLKKKQELDGYRALNEESVRSLDSVLSGFNLDCGRDYFAAIKKLEAAVEEERLSSVKIAALNEEMGSLKLAGIETASGETESVESLNRKLKIVQAQYDENSKSLSDKRYAAKTYEAEADSLCDLENRTAELAERLKTAEEQLDLVKTTLEFLQTADENLKTKYRSPLKDSLNKYLSYAADGVVADIDTDFKITVEEKGGGRETDYYSKGFRNLFEICKRFALTDVLFTAEKPFIVLDDPFCNLDDEKLKRSLSLILKLSESYQIIYLVCHESRVSQ